MIQYNLRLDKKLKHKAQHLAHKQGMSENFLYNKAIEDFVRRSEQEEFVSYLLKKRVSDQRIHAVLSKVKQSKNPPFFQEDL